MAERFDITTTKKWKLDGRKRLIVESTPTRSGVFTYFDNTGKMVKELRHPDDVFSRETMDSLKGIIYTTQKNHVSLMNPETVRERTYGFTLQNAERVDNHSKIDIKINDGSEIKAIMGGKSLELSNGYTCDVIPETGEFEGEKYDARQKNIVYDHVARVEKARGGESCRIRLDSESAISGIEAERLDSGGTQNHSTGDEMGDKTKVIQFELPLRESGEFRLDAQEIEINDDQKGVVDVFKKRESKLFSALKKINTEMTKQSVKMDSLTKELETASKTVEGSISKEKLDQEITKRVNLFAMADQFKIKDYKKLDVVELGKQIVKESGQFNEAKLDSEEYVNFAIEHLQDDHMQKVIKSRQNLENGNVFKFDKSDDDLYSDSELETA